MSGAAGPYALEHFSCGAGPAGWRYVATRTQPGSGAALGRLDVVLDGSGAVVRAAVEAAGWSLRGGAIGPDVLWRRGAQERSERAQGFTGSSPVWLLAATRVLAAATEPVRLRLVRLGDDALATSVVDQAWVRTGAVQRDGLSIASWRVDDLATGEQGVLQVAGDLVLAAPHVRLDTLVSGSGPP